MLVAWVVAGSSLLEERPLQSAMMQASTGMAMVITMPVTARAGQVEATQGMAVTYSSMKARQYTLSESEAKVRFGQKMKAPFTHLKHCQICRKYFDTRTRQRER